MTNKEALDILKDYHESQTRFNEIIGELDDEFCDALGLAISALEKQDGKKPVYKKIVYSHHEWVRDENGEIDNFAFEADYHNGPRCKRCGKAFCEHCCSHEEYNEKINGGPCDCSYYECPTCGEKVYSRQKVCDCGQKILWE